MLQRDENEDLHDLEGLLCHAAGQKIDGQGAATKDAKVLRQKTMA